MEAKDVEGLITTLKNNDFNSYISFLEEKLPKKIYSYYAHSTNNLDMISSGKINLKNPASFNDPFDSLIQVVNETEKHYFGKVDHTIQKILYSKDIKVSQFRKLILQKNILSMQIDYPQKIQILREIYDELLSPNNPIEDINLRGILFEINQFSGFANQYMGDFISDSGVACFSEEKNNVLMWSHYGRSHSGLCVEYLTEEIIFNCKEQNYYFVPVYYNENMYRDYYETISEERLTYLWNLPQFMYKNSAWSYEKEWRLIRFEDIDHYVQSPKVSQIFLGTSFKNINN